MEQAQQMSAMVTTLADALQNDALQVFWAGDWCRT